MGVTGCPQATASGNTHTAEAQESSQVQGPRSRVGRGPLAGRLLCATVLCASQTGPRGTPARTLQGGDARSKVGPPRQVREI